MPRIPTTQRQTQLPNIPSPTGAGRAINTNPGAGQGLQEAGRQIGELAQRMNQQALETQKIELETKARSELANAETMALQSPNFRNAPELFEARAQAIADEVISQADPQIQNDMRLQIGRTAAITKAELRRDAVRKSQDQQVQSFRNFSSEMGSQFAAAETPQERQAIFESIQSKAQGLVESGAMLPEEAEAMARDARLNAFEGRAQQLIVDKKPAKAREFIRGSELPPERKRILLSLAESQAQQNNSELRAMIGQVEQFAADRGRLPDNVSGVPYTKLQEQVQGTEFGDSLAGIEQNVTAMQEQAQRPLSQQAETLQQMRGQVSSPAENNRLRLMAQVTSRARDAADSRPYQFAENHSIIGKVRDLPVREMLSEDTSGVRNILTERVGQARRLSQYYGKRISPLTPGETQQVTQLVSSGDADTGTRVLSELMGNLDFTSGQLLADSIAQENPKIGVAALLSPDTPQVTREILAGKDLDDQSVKLPQGEAREVADEVLGEALQGSPASRSAFTEAASSIYRNRAIKAGETAEFDDDRFDRALRLVAFGSPTQSGDVQGGPVRINGTMTLPPKPGMSRETFQDHFSKIRDPQTSAEILGSYANGLPGQLSAEGRLEQMNPADVGEGQPVYVGRGRYMIRMDDGGFVHSLDPQSKEPTGQPLVLDLRAAEADSAFEAGISIRTGGN